MCTHMCVEFMCVQNIYRYIDYTAIRLPFVSLDADADAAAATISDDA